MRLQQFIDEKKSEVTDWKPLVKMIAKKMREDFGQSSISSGFLIGYNNKSKQFNELTYFQDGGSMRSSGSATTTYMIPPNATSFELQQAMKKMLKDPKIMKMKAAFSNMAQGQADYYKNKGSKKWPGI